MKLLLPQIILSIAAVAGCHSALLAQSSLIEEQNIINEEADFETELRTPLVPDKAKPFVQSYMRQIATNLYNDKFNVETMRKGEVVIVTIPTDLLFAPNETTLLPSAKPLLDEFKQYLLAPEKFKVVLAAHSDDTGSEAYTLTLTEDRIFSILEYYDSIGVATDNAIGFPQGFSDPLKPNISRENRASNRRLEIFIVPQKQLIDSARPKKK